MRLVNVRTERCTHYIGRGTAPSGVAVGLGNPMKVLKPSDRETVVKFFEDWVRNDPGVVASRAREAIRALPADAVLGCWCSPLLCHGEIIMKIWKELHG